ncbi:hypothetical protein [Flavobacterium sp. J27]|uniref:hypothetical protein n=1 Tax=Flavobacterium sp. J27 TaxID=2060419 RepID=UPI0010315497|nr:hypothetical protein [Flavobacterium sp. J27]
MTKKLLLLLLSVLSLSCKETNQEPIKSSEEQIQSFYAEEEDTILPDDIEEITEPERKTYHIDTQYEYKYRTGRSNHYEYNYNIIGHDTIGNEITGTINIRDKYGAGKIINAKGEKRAVFVEWVKNGKLVGKDEDSITYEFVVDK